MFFDELRIPRPDVKLNVGSGSHARQTAGIMAAFEPVVVERGADLVVVVGDNFDPAALHGTLASHLETDGVDLADLARASGLLRYRAARDGQVVHETQPGAGDRFRLEAASFWCDAAPVLQRGYETVLAELER